MLKIKSLSKKYGSHQVLRDVSLSLKRGDIHAILGANGAGKTTLFKCICGLESFTGEIEYDGGIIKNETGYLPTEPYFFPNMSGYEYLQLLCNARGRKVKDLDSFNLFSLPLSRYAETYSTGMQKQLAITGILLQKNEIFILDEPFNGVDISSSLLIKDILSRLKKANKIVLISSHILPAIQESCDFLYFLKDGIITKSILKGQDFEFEMRTDNKANAILDSLL
ncbi:MAG: ATP-binding cassette domain-containing protein [Bacteroidetes bacterium]|nr:ATP-binding cassette domain-containing protein [Bacteroidota bacterium]